MKTLNFLHTADWHADNDPKKSDKLQKSLDQMLAYVQENKVNVIIHAGDIWEKKQSYSDKSGVPMVINYLKALSNHVDFVLITKGNNSHDEPGSISLLHQLEPNIYAYEYPVCLAHSKDFGFLDLLRAEEKFGGDEYDYIVSLIPYPTKANFVSETSIDNNNADFIEKFEEVFDLIGNVTQPYTCPKLLAFHGNVVGSRLSTGQTLVSQDIMIAPSTLKKANQNYYALGHIHLQQEVQPNMVYSGSIYNKSWGETEQKSFEIIEFEIGSEPNIVPLMHRGQIMLTSARPMITVEASFCPDIQNADFVFDEDLSDEKYANAEVRFRCDVKENDRKLLSEDKIKWIKNYFGEDVKIELNIIPDERESRSEKIMQCKTLLDEVEEYAKVVEFDLPEGVKQKVLSMQNEEVIYENT